LYLKLSPKKELEPVFGYDVDFYKVNQKQNDAAESFLKNRKKALGGKA
jgi:hypothetical protein